MARSKRVAVAAGVRGHLARWLQELSDVYGAVPGCPFPQQLADLRAGRPVTVWGYELPESLRLPPMGRFTVHADGSIVEVP
ncbi:MAG: hypothetical protein R2737_10325 [Candidatus Nanopelagicales bacterium]